MISAETMKWRLQQGSIAEFDLVFWKGTGRVVERRRQALVCRCAASAPTTPGSA